MNVEKGDIAMMVHPDHWGRVVSVIQAVEPVMQFLGREHGHLWKVESLGSDIPAFLNGHAEWPTKGRIVLVPDKDLRRIDPPAAVDSTDVPIERDVMAEDCA